MSKVELIAPTLLGVEAITAKEIRNLGYDNVVVENGRVRFVSDILAICRANLWLRTAERVLINIGEFKATSFDELFEKTKALPWGEFIPENGAFPVVGYSLKSKLFSVPDCQSIIKKAIVEKMKTKYKKQWFEEDGPLYKIKFSLMKDTATLMIDTSGDSLHKRGYRQISNIAPIRETLAASMIYLSRWNSQRPFLDPFCGSGTLPIEAALMGANIAPGQCRSFAAETWPQLPKKLWQKAHQEAQDCRKDVDMEIHGADIDNRAIEISMENAKKADVKDNISFKHIALKDVKPFGQYGCIVCNPPYGERMGKKEDIDDLYREIGQVFEEFDTWSKFILTPLENFEQIYGKKANKNRKLYNGMIKCYLYQYFGPIPKNNKGGL